MTELARIDAVGLAAMIREGDLSPVELIDDTIARVEALNPDLNAVIHPSFEQAREAAAGELPDGPFQGVPMMMKDLWPAQKGEYFHQGVKGLRDAGYRADLDADITVAYREAGFVQVGRTNTPEMGLAATTEPEAYGPTHNPWDLERGPGGSSGGAAAAVAGGMLPAANASDGGGSIRIPAAMCGLVGLKPSRGRISMGPQRDEWGNSVQHVVCHTMRDCAAILDATTRPFPGQGVIAPALPAPAVDLIGDDPLPLRIGVLARSNRSSIPIDPEVAAAVRATADRLADLGHEIVDDAPPALDDETLIASAGAQWSAGVATALDTFGEWIGRELTADDVEPFTWALAQRGRSMAAVETAHAADAATTFRRRMAQWWADGFDLLLAPTCLRPAPRLGECLGTPENPFANVDVTLAYATLTSPFNTTGQPALSLPLAQSGTGLPIGLQFVADYGREDLLFALGGQLERAYDWAATRAPLHP